MVNFELEPLDYFGCSRRMRAIIRELTSLAFGSDIDESVYGENALIAAVDGRSILGITLFHMIAPYDELQGYVSALAVSEGEKRHQGIGSTLLQSAECAFIEQGLSCSSLLPSNGQAARFFRRRGYVPDAMDFYVKPLTQTLHELSAN